MKPLQAPPRPEDCLLPAPTVPDGRGEGNPPPPPLLPAPVSVAATLSPLEPRLPATRVEPALPPSPVAPTPDIDPPAEVEPLEPDAADGGFEVTAFDMTAAMTEPMTESATPTTDGAPTFSLPSLPAVTPAAASPVASDAAPAFDPTAWAGGDVTAAMAAAPKKQGASSGSPLRSLVATLGLVVLAAALGAGAHVGYDWYVEGEDPRIVVSAPENTGDLAAWRHVDPPAIRYTDTTTTIVTDLGMREVIAHRDLVSGSRLVRVAETSFAGETNTVEVELRDDRAFIRSAPDAEWAPSSIEAATAIIGDEGLTDVFTVSDLFPAEALPFATVLSSAEVELPLGPIHQQPLSDATPDGTTLAGAGDDAAPGAATPNDAAPNGDAATGDGSAPQHVATQALADAADVVDAINDRGLVDAPNGDLLRPIARPPVEPTTVWHYRVTIDTEAFRAAEGAAFAAWERQLGRAAGSQFDVWVDADGIVRRLIIDAGGSKVTQTLVGGAPTSPTFVLPDAGSASAPAGDVPDGSTGS